jgi:ABC-type iron transport system FetAB ATPase subunit
MRLETETPETSFKETKEYGVFYGKSLFSEAGSKEPIIEHMLNKNDCIFISAKSGEGKSILALQMMAAMTSGRPFLKAFDVPKPVRDIRAYRSNVSWTRVQPR